MHYKDYKTILSPSNGMNVYRGCTHGCIYCDSRSACYQMHHDFEDIEVKRDAPALLAAQLKRRRERCMIGTGAMSDPYIPLERELGHTRQCLEVIERHGFGLAIQTKSDLILRDIELLKAIHKNARCVAQLTLTTHDEALCRVVEPNVSTTRQRVEALMALREAGIPTVVWICPILPFINDTEANLRALLDDCVACGVRGIVNFGMGMTLREGNREHFYRCLDRDFPGLKQRYAQQFGNRYVCDSPNSAPLMRMLADTCEAHGILCDPEAVFADLRRFEQKHQQISLFPT